MKIKLSDVGKRFNREWIFKGANIEFDQTKAYAITGANGSGKSTFLQTVAGLLQPSSGKVAYTQKGVAIDPEKTHHYLSFSAPYLELIEEMTLLEALQFHQQFKPFLAGFDAPKIIEAIGLSAASGKQIQDFSSGMKQRVKLAQAVFCNTPILLLDEPCSNFDAAGFELYQSLMEKWSKNRLVIVCSNDSAEYSFCDEVIEISQFK